jgi:hypothetical protein
MSGLPSVVFFPYIDMDEALLRSLLCLWQEIHFLQPKFSIASTCTEKAQASGWVRVHRPLAADLNEEQAARLLRDFDHLGRLYQDSGYLAYLKHGGAGRLAEEEPGYELLRELRRYGQPSPADKKPDIRGQLLLQMAQDLDRQRREIREALGELHGREAALYRNLGVGQENGELQAEWEKEPLPTPEEDDFLIPQRLRAWNEMSAAWKPAAFPFLLTNNPGVLEHLAETAAASSPAPDPFVRTFRLTLPLFAPPDLDGVGRLRREFDKRVPWKVFCEKMEVCLQEARRAEWKDAASRDLLARGRALASYFHDEVLGHLLESVAAVEPTWEAGWREARLEGLVFPGCSQSMLLGGDRPDVTESERTGPVVLYLDDRTGAPDVADTASPIDFGR